MFSAICLELIDMVTALGLVGWWADWAKMKLNIWLPTAYKEKGKSREIMDQTTIQKNPSF